MKKIFFCLLLLPLLAITSCHKEGPGGKAIIRGQVKHHDKLISNAVVYIKYGTKDFPGDDVKYYDASANVDAEANYIFQDLKRGDYYLFGVGTDTIQSGIVPVIGGIPVEIKSKTETVEANVLVTE